MYLSTVSVGQGFVILINFVSALTEKESSTQVKSSFRQTRGYLHHSTRLRVFDAQQLNEIRQDKRAVDRECRSKGGDR